MKRTLAVVFIGLGLLSVGVALGLLYLDVRELEIRVAQAELDGGDSDDAGVLAMIGHTGNVLAALVFGSLGAGLTGAGCVLAFFELPFMQRGPRYHDGSDPQAA